MRADTLLEADQKDVAKFESLRCVKRYQRHGVGVGVVFVRVRGKGRVFEKPLQARASTDVVEFGSDLDQLANVFDPSVAIGGSVVQRIQIADSLQDRVD